MTFPCGRRRAPGPVEGALGATVAAAAAAFASAAAAATAAGAVRGAAAQAPTDPPPSHALALAAKKAEQAYLCARLHKALQTLGKVGETDAPGRNTTG